MSNELYADPELYDLLHADTAAGHFDVLVEVVRQSSGETRKGSRWLEPACGSGRFLAEGLRQGLEVSGFDRSQAMVAYARRRCDLDTTRLFVADMEAFAPYLKADSFEVAFNLDNTFRHLEDDRSALAHLRELARVLRPDGIAVIGLQLTDYGGDVPDEDVWTGERAGTQAVQVVQYLPPAHAADRREQVIAHIVVTRPDGSEEHLDTTDSLRTYDAAQWSRLIRSSPFEACDWYDFEGRPSDAPPYGYGFAVLRRTR